MGCGVATDDITRIQRPNVCEPNFVSTESMDHHRYIMLTPYPQDMLTLPLEQKPIDAPIRTSGQPFARPADPSPPSVGRGVSVFVASASQTEHRSSQELIRRTEKDTEGHAVSFFFSSLGN